jgi:DNA-binding transcriptional MerR regulator
VSETAYKLEELAKAAGTSPRTVRYYVQRGLLPPPVFKGKDSAYGREHLVRLRAIRVLQEAYLPLDAIAVELEGKTNEQIDAIAEATAKTKPAPAPPRNVEIVVTTPLVRSPSWRRVEIARGVELHVADDASADAKALAEKILNVISSLQEGA